MHAYEHLQESPPDSWDFLNQDYLVKHPDAILNKREAGTNTGTDDCKYLLLHLLGVVVVVVVYCCYCPDCCRCLLLLLLFFLIDDSPSNIISHVFVYHRE